MKYRVKTNRLVNLVVFLYIFFNIVIPGKSQTQTPIDRKALVQRHTVIITKADPLASLSVGNGKFAFTVDVTGLQTFPKEYEKGVPLGTQSEWGWHSFANNVGYRFEETLKEYTFNNKKYSYAVQWTAPEQNKKAADWFRQNPHRLQLGNLGFELTKKNGTKANLADIQNIRQELNMWTGEIKSAFTLEGVPVRVSTFSHQTQDVIAVSVQSDLIKAGQLKIKLQFPYPTGEWTDEGTNWTQPDKHRSAILNQTINKVQLIHQLDTTAYFVNLNLSDKAAVSPGKLHQYIITPDKKDSTFQFSCGFSSVKPVGTIATLSQTQENSKTEWKAFWSRGGAIDFSGSTDPRARELERRLVLSQYLTKIQCAGMYPPQETGLTYNSWFGRPHLEMHWWHGVHFALWGRIDLLQKSMDWYARAAPKAKEIAQRQGYDGIRWQKMTDPAGNEGPSSVGAFLIWQQPHFIYFAELLYRDKKSQQTLLKYQDLVFATADFMASYAYYDKNKERYILGKGLIPAQERFKPEETFNPTFELAYWHWALSVAQQWRERLNLPRNKKWDDVLQKLSPLPPLNGVYLATESAPDSYTNPAYKTDHPAVLGAYGILPGVSMVNKATMQKTFNLVWDTWHWKDTWGWDFPMTAMTATRLGLPEKAIEALLMDIKTNTYLPNGHNYQDERLRLYLPGNGGLLTAIAMMCAGYDSENKVNPGIPATGKWQIKWEGLRKMP